MNGTHVPLKIFFGWTVVGGESEGYAVALSAEVNAERILER